MIQPRSASDHSKTIFLFDMDGTLTHARCRISAHMADILKQLKRYVTVGVVSGSNCTDIMKQLQPPDEKTSVDDIVDYIFSENGTMAYMKGEPFGDAVDMKAYLGESKLQDLINFCLHYIADLKLPMKRGSFIQLRRGMMNISPIGRDCTMQERKEFVLYDGTHHVRSTFAQILSDHFNAYNVRFALGGQISIDCYPVEWNKSYCLRYLKAFRTIHFFGDKTSPTGNDYDIFVHPDVIGTTSRKSCSHTTRVRTHSFFSMSLCPLLSMCTSTNKKMAHVAFTLNDNKVIMISRVRGYLASALHAYIHQELLDYCPTLCARNRERLERMTLKASIHFTTGCMGKSLMEYRSCLILVMQNVEDPDTLESLQRMIFCIPCGSFTEPSDATKRIISLDESTDSYTRELIDRFRATSIQVISLSQEQKQALCRTLRYHTKHPGIICPISFDPILLDGVLTSDVVVIFEEEFIYSCYDSEFFSSLKQEETVISLMALPSDANESRTCTFATKQRRGPTGFATQLMDGLVVNMLQVAKNCFTLPSVPLYPRDSARDSTENARNHYEQTVFSDFIVSRPYLSLTSNVHLNVETRASSRMWTLQRNDALNVPHQDDTDKNDACSSTPRSPQRATQFRVFRCHLFKGEGIIRWFDTGQWTNPLTRVPILPDDWCRLTCMDCKSSTS